MQNMLTKRATSIDIGISLGFPNSKVKAFQNAVVSLW